MKTRLLAAVLFLLGAGALSLAFVVVTGAGACETGCPHTLAKVVAGGAGASGLVLWLGAAAALITSMTAPAEG